LAHLPRRHAVDDVELSAALELVTRDVGVAVDAFTTELRQERIQGVERGIDDDIDVRVVRGAPW
jgi:hypothetical protein